MELTQEQQSAFFESIDIKSKNECWEWQGSVFWKSNPEIRYQYGRFYANGKAFRAHKISYWLFHGEIAAGFIVRHKCDNPLCVNPNHLILGTTKQNAEDRSKRKRTRNQHTGRINDGLYQRTA